MQKAYPVLTILIITFLSIGCSSHSTDWKDPSQNNSQGNVQIQYVLAPTTALLAVSQKNPQISPQQSQPTGTPETSGTPEISEAPEEDGTSIEEGTEEDLTDDEFDDSFDDLEDEFEATDQVEVFDPLSGYNRAITVFNDKLYTWVLEPVAACYAWVVPEFARRAVSRFFKNLLFPIRFVNNVLQLKFKNAGEETLRFVINSTVGLGGLGDPAKNWLNLEAHPEDFGQTLGFYGVGSGFHIVLPFLGPSNLRDMFALYPDSVYLDPTSTDVIYLDPEHRIQSTEVQLGLKVFKTVNDTSLILGQYESIKKDAIDLYPFLREAYEQKRDKEIRE